MQRYDITGIELTPSAGGVECLGNGKNPNIECCCDECSFYLDCFPSECCSTKCATDSTNGKDGRL